MENSRSSEEGKPQGKIKLTEEALRELQRHYPQGRQSRLIQIQNFTRYWPYLHQELLEQQKKGPDSETSYVLGTLDTASEVRLTQTTQ
jgi:hypothetical protein